LVGVGYLAYDAQRDDDDGAPAVTPTVQDTGVSLPQNPSLRLFLEQAVWYVENDGNVTMSQVEVRDDGGAVVCEIGTMPPADRQPCDGAGDGQGLVAVGQGPQGQPVEVPSG